MRAYYGIDAPGLVRGFFFVGLLASVAAFGLARLRSLAPWSHYLATIIFFIAIYALGMFAYMLWGSLITKVRGREAILDLIPWSGAEHVLDVGCGRGLLLVAAARRLTTGHATGVDLWLAHDQHGNSEDATLANAQLEGVAERVTLQTSDIRSLPFADQTFEVVLSHWVVHNLRSAEERTRALAEMYRVLKPGGTILLTDIALRDEYRVTFQQLGVQETRVVVSSGLRDAVNILVSFGSFAPATLVGRRRA